MEDWLLDVPMLMESELYLPKEQNQNLMKSDEWIYQ